MIETQTNTQNVTGTEEETPPFTSPKAKFKKTLKTCLTSAQVGRLGAGAVERQARAIYAYRDTAERVHARSTNSPGSSLVGDAPCRGARELPLDEGRAKRLLVLVFFVELCMEPFLGLSMVLDWFFGGRGMGLVLVSAWVASGCVLHWYSPYRLVLILSAC